MGSCNLKKAFLSQNITKARFNLITQQGVRFITFLFELKKSFYSTYAYKYRLIIGANGTHSPRNW